METLKDRLLYDYDPEELPKIFNKLFLKLKNIHKENKFVPWLNINSIVCSEDDFIFVNSVKTDNIEEKSGETLEYPYHYVFDIGLGKMYVTETNIIFVIDSKNKNTTQDI